MLIIMDTDNIPNAVAVIPDGNRRWAKRHKLSFLSGYQYGVQKFIDFSEWCKEFGVRNISVWALSTENINRSRTEVNALFNIYRRFSRDKDLIERLHRNETKFLIVGNRRLLPRDLDKSLARIEEETSIYNTRTINLLIGYGGREDIITAVKKVIAEKVRYSTSVTEQLFRRFLESSIVPDIDFVIRTSGEERLSGFLPWQASYAELYFSKKLWPDFERRDFKKALNDYGRRHRRFGT